MATKIIEVHLCTCDLCGHEWITRAVPERCAKCKRFNWDNGGLTKADLARARQIIERPRTRLRASKRV